MLSTINLEDTPFEMDIFRFAGEQAGKGFTQQPETIDTPCEFLRKNNLKSYHLSFLKNGNHRLSVFSPEGREHYAIHRNFVLTYLKLVRSYNNTKFRNNHEKH